MKKKTLKAMREEKDWHKGLDLAMDKRPGTEFDREFERAEMSLNPALSVLSRQLWLSLGEGLARLVHDGDSTTLHRMADALNVWRRHKPEPDPVRAAVISRYGMCRSFTEVTRDGTLRKNLLPDPKVRDVMRSLRQQKEWARNRSVPMSNAARVALLGLRIDENTPRLIRRYRDELRNQLHAHAGPLKQTRTKSP